jgi:hypothetical protein
MNISIYSAAMIVDSSGPFDTSGLEMGNTLKANRGIKTLLEIYRTLFRIPENTNHYSEKDYRAAERKFLKYALAKRRMKLEEEPLEE